MSIPRRNRAEPGHIVAEWLEGTRPTTYKALARKAVCDEKTIRRLTADQVLVSLNKKYEEKWILPKEAPTKVPEEGRWSRVKHCMGNICAKLRPDRLGTIRWGKVRFHELNDIREVLLHLAKEITHGITQREAERHVGRSTSEVFQVLVAEGKLVEERFGGEKVYFHPEHIEDQRMRRRTCKVIIFREEPSAEERTYIPIEKVLETLEGFDSELLMKLRTERNGLPCLLAHLVQSMRKGNYRWNEQLLNADPRIRGACHFEGDVVPDYTTLCRHFTSMDYGLLKKLFMDVVRDLHGKNIVDGKYLAIDGTHIFAWAKQRQKNGEVRNPPEMAAWGKHHQYFFGYTVTIIIDVKSELPIALKIHTPKISEISMVIPLVNDIETEYPDMNVEALFGDALYDTKDEREYVENHLGCELLTPINPRRNKHLKKFKKTLKELFDKHGEDIESVEDAVRFLGITFLDEWGFELGGPEGNRLLGAIKERLLRKARIGVERVFSRLKSSTLFERPKVRLLPSVLKHITMCLLSLLLIALTAHRMGIPQNALSWSRIF